MSSTPTTTRKSNLTLIGFGLGAFLVLGLTLRTCDSPKTEKTPAAVASTPPATQSTPYYRVTVPANTQEGGLRIESRAGWTICFADVRAVDIKYQDLSWNWMTRQPTDGVRNWELRSKTDKTIAEFVYWFDTDSNCKTPVAEG